MSLLTKSVSDYHLWMISRGYSHYSVTLYDRTLCKLSSFVEEKKIVWDDIFQISTITLFKNESKIKDTYRIITSFSKYLYEHKLIKKPFNHKHKTLPPVYETYFSFLEMKNCPNNIYRARQVLGWLNAFLLKENISFADTTITVIDSFYRLHRKGYGSESCSKIRSILRGFFKYLYLNKKIKRNFAPFIVGAPQFAESKPPKYFLSHEIQQLFSSVNLDTSQGLRLNAFLHLAYTLGLRPKEISLIRLDDISFKKGELSIRKRKNQNPDRLPLATNTLQSIAAYIIGGRPSPSKERLIFLKSLPPYDSITSIFVSGEINRHIQSVGLKGSAYWLRHTYAQNLLENGASVFEIKEMLGHERIQTTRRYIKIHTKLMREVLFDEAI